MKKRLGFTRILVACLVVAAVGCSTDTTVSASPTCPPELPNCNSTLPDGEYTASGFSSSSDEQFVVNYAKWVVADVERAWTPWFASQGGASANPATNLTLIQGSTSFESKCTNTAREPLVTYSDTPNAFFCAIDAFTYTNGVTLEGNLIIPVTTLKNMWSGNILGKMSAVTGDFAAAFTLAHEYGHNVAFKISKFWNLQPPQSPNNELIADCFGGNWTATVYGRGLQDATDLDEAIAAINTFNDSGDHGTVQQRQYALQVGLSGNPMDCIKTYWQQG